MRWRWWAGLVACVWSTVGGLVRMHATVRQQPRRQVSTYRRYHGDIVRTYTSETIALLVFVFCRTSRLECYCWQTIRHHVCAHMANTYRDAIIIPDNHDDVVAAEAVGKLRHEWRHGNASAPGAQAVWRHISRESAQGILGSHAVRPSWCGTSRTIGPDWLPTDHMRSTLMVGMCRSTGANAAAAAAYYARDLSARIPILTSFTRLNRCVTQFPSIGYTAYD